MKKPDPKGYYAALNISPGASPQEIRLAYTFLKQAYTTKRKRIDAKVVEAYEVLGDTRKRRQYNTRKASRRGLLTRPDGESRLNSIPALVVTMLILVATLFFIFGPDVMGRFVTFETGDQVFWKETMKPMAVVLEFDPDHQFPGSPRVAAYLIQPESGQNPLWYSARDLHRHCTTR